MRESDNVVVPPGWEVYGPLADGNGNEGWIELKLKLKLRTN